MSNQTIPSTRTPQHPHHYRAILAITAIVILLTVTGLGRADDPTTPDTIAVRRTPVVRVFNHAKDAVVNISSTQIIQVRSRPGVDRLFEELFELPFVPRHARRYKQTSVGSGFVLHPDGYIVTNAHVVARTTELNVTFSDKKEYQADVVAVDQDRDLAILKINPPHPLVPIRLGRSSDLMVGETVIAIGNPLGYEHTVTTGIVSALNRTLDVGQDLSFTGLIQTDASINPGNSGGPLLNILGQLIGVNTAIRADAQNIGFAIPVDHLREILPELLDVERRYRLFTGMQISREDPCRVTDVTHPGPAQHAGIQTGDQLLAIDDQPITSGIDFHVALIGHSPGQPLKLTLERDGQTFHAILIPAERSKPSGQKLLKTRFGIEAAPLTPRMAQAIGLQGLKGLLITGIEPQSPAQLAGFARGDIIIRIGRYKATTLQEVGELLDPLKPGQIASLNIIRVSGRTTFRLSARVRAR